MREKERGREERERTFEKLGRTWGVCRRSESEDVVVAEKVEFEFWEVLKHFETCCGSWCNSMCLETPLKPFSPANLPDSLSLSLSLYFFVFLSGHLLFACLRVKSQSFRGLYRLRVA